MNGFRLLFAPLAMLALAPAAAQDAAPPPEQSESVGPRELENFNLSGRVTRPAEEQPAANVTQPAAPPQAQPESTEPRQTAQPSRNDVREPARQVAETQRGASGGDLLSRPLTRPEARSAPVATATAEPVVPLKPALLPPAPKESSSLLMWVAALLFATGGAVVYWFVRQRGTASPALAGGYAAVQPRADPIPDEPAGPLPRAAAPAPDGQPLVRRPMPTTLRPKPDAPVSGGITTKAPSAVPVGIVASSLRPWIEVELEPDRALLDENGAAIAFNVTLVNSGSAPARDVSIEACLLNAGAKQDVELTEFYQRPRKDSDSIPIIAPQSRIPLRTAVKIPREMIQEYEVEGRKLFMPMVAVSTRYRWSSGEGQTGVSFMVGKGREEEERLAPFRVDQGARSWKGLGARRYEKGLRR